MFLWVYQRSILSVNNRKLKNGEFGTPDELESKYFQKKEDSEEAKSLLNFTNKSN